MKVIGVIGAGFVGNALSIGMSTAFEVGAFDIKGTVSKAAFNAARDKQGRDNIQTFVERLETSPGSDYTDMNFVGEPYGDRFTKVYFICLPTPMLKSGECDVSIVENTLKSLANIPGHRVAVVKSTVPPGTTERWNKMFQNTGLTVVFNPEFLTEANAIDDFKNQNRIILGGPRPQIDLVKQVYQNVFPNVQIVKTSSSIAEMTKYMTNIHLAVKISLANEFYQICKALKAKGIDIDYDRCVECATLDERLGKSHWQVPGPMPADDTGEPAFGFSGSCFPKDLNSLRFLAETIDVIPTMMRATWEKNLEVRPQRDWEKLIGRAISKKS